MMGPGEAAAVSDLGAVDPRGAARDRVVTVLLVVVDVVVGFFVAVFVGPSVTILAGVTIMVAQWDWDDGVRPLHRVRTPATTGTEPT
jgi:hypothetical protein